MPSRSLSNARNTLWLGSHLSISGGMHHALEAAAELKCDCVQVFTKNQRQWRVKPLREEDVETWKAAIETIGWAGEPARVVSHNSYLVNMASPDPKDGRSPSRFSGRNWNAASVWASPHASLIQAQFEGARKPAIPTSSSNRRTPTRRRTRPHRALLDRLERETRCRCERHWRTRWGAAPISVTTLCSSPDPRSGEGPGADRLLLRHLSRGGGGSSCPRPRRARPGASGRDDRPRPGARSPSERPIGEVAAGRTVMPIFSMGPAARPVSGLLPRFPPGGGSRWCWKPRRKVSMAVPGMINSNGCLRWLRGPDRADIQSTTSINSESPMTSSGRQSSRSQLLPVGLRSGGA